MIQQPEEFLSNLNKEGLSHHYVNALITNYLEKISPEDLHVIEVSQPYLVFNKQQEKIAVCILDDDFFESENYHEGKKLIHYVNLYDCYSRICN